MRKRLDEVAVVTKLAGFEFTKYMKYIEDGEIVAIRALNLKDGRLVLDDVRRIAKNVSDELPRSQLHKYDIVLSYTGTIGESAQIMENGKYHLAPNVAKVIPNTNEIDPVFLFQYIRSWEFKRQMLNYAHGSTQPTIPMATIRELTVPVFTLETEGKIASILDGIDKKIEKNTEVNKNLEQQAQAMYKSHYIDLEPFDGTLPDSWHLGTVSEIIELHDSKRIPLSSRERADLDKIYPYYGATSVMDYVDRYLFDGIYLLLGEDGTVVDDKGFPILQYVDGKFWVNNHAHILTGKNGFNVELLYLLFSLTSVKAIVTGAVQPKISQANLNKVPVVIPSSDELRQFDDCIQPIFAEIRNLRNENAKLANLRDGLLPKLMSGELDVSNLDL